MGRLEKDVDAIIFDIDGTLADIRHRRHHVTGAKPNWKSFNAEMVDDPPLADVCYLAELLGSHPLAPSFVKLFLFSGREETHRKVTEDFLRKNVPAYFKASEALMMRAEGDFRADTLVKKDMLRLIQSAGFNVRIVVDDRPSVVQMWKDEGLTVLAHDSEWTQVRLWPTGKLHMMVGPSCAGKSTFIKTKSSLPDSAVISSDALRIEIAGSIGDMDVNDQVFSYMTAAVKARIENGLETIVDATNIHARARRPMLDACPFDAQIFYHVIDRPLHEKEKDAGWREDIVMKDGKTLIRSHHESFKSALPTILAGDSDPRVTVFDHRRKP
jgi:predicted kinase